MVDYCTEGHCLATENCPAESVTKVGALDYVREDYGESIQAEDDPYLIVNMEKALEPQEPTEENPAGSPGGCPVHSSAGTGSEEPDGEAPIDSSQDPSDPNYQPPSDSGMTAPPGNNDSSEQHPTTPTAPTEPTEPSEPEPTDPSGDEWWNSFWPAASGG